MGLQRVKFILNILNICVFCVFMTDKQKNAGLPCPFLKESVPDVGPM